MVFVCCNYRIWIHLLCVGEKFVIWFGYEPRIYLTNAEVIQQFLSSKHLNDCGRSLTLQKLVSVVFEKGVFSVNGEQWAHQRRIVAPAFNMDMLKVNMNIINGKINYQANLISFGRKG